MGKQIQITLGSGETHDVDLQPFSMVIVRTRKPNNLGVIEDVEQAFSDVAALEVVDVEDAKMPEPAITQESPYLSAPESVVQYAQVAPVGDAATIVDQAIAKFGADDEHVAKAQQIVTDRMQAETDTVEPAADTATTDATETADSATAEPATETATDTEPAAPSAPDAATTEA